MDVHTIATAPAPTAGEALVSAFRVPATLGSLAFVRGALALMLDRRPLGADGAGRMLLAASEAVSNAIEHGSSGQDAEVEVRVAARPDGATLTVIDQGRPGERPRIDLRPMPPSPSETRGRGLMIMRALSDEIAVEPAGDGTCVRMDFRRERAGEVPPMAAAG